MGRQSVQQCRHHQEQGLLRPARRADLGRRHREVREDGGHTRDPELQPDPNTTKICNGVDPGTLQGSLPRHGRVHVRVGAQPHAVQPRQQPHEQFGRMRQQRAWISPPVLQARRPTLHLRLGRWRGELVRVCRGVRRFRRYRLGRHVHAPAVHRDVRELDQRRRWRKGRHVRRRRLGDRQDKQRWRGRPHVPLPRSHLQYGVPGKLRCRRARVVGRA